MTRTNLSQGAIGGATPKRDKEMCGLCRDGVQRKDKALQCDLCEKWHHCKCTSVTEQAYNFYQNNDKLPWVCNKCIKEKKEENNLYELITGMVKQNEEEKKEMIYMLKELSKKMTKMENDQATKMQQLSEQMTKMEDKMERRMNEKIKLAEGEMMLKINSEMEEKLERVKRKNNLVIHGMKESINGDNEERLKLDMQKVEKLLKELEVTAPKMNLARLGKKLNIEKPRPIKIELENEGEKFKILKKAGRIRETDVEEFKKIIISGDMTIKQRELDKILREELKERRQKGERNIKIKNGRIVTTTEQKNEAST